MRAQAEVLDRAIDAGDAHHVAGTELVLEDDEDAGQPVPHEGLRAEADGDAHHPEAGDGGTDVEPEDAEDHEERDDRQQRTADADAQALDGAHSALQLPSREQVAGVAGPALDEVPDAHPRRRAEDRVGDERDEHHASDLEGGHRPIRQHEVVHRSRW